MGLWSIYRSDFRNLAGPLALIIIFGTVQLLALGVITGETISGWWPIILIIIGVSVILTKLRGPSPAESGVDEVDLMAIFGGNDSLITTDSFVGGDITAMFGGVDLDLRDSKIKSPPAKVNVFVLFGGTDIKVPEDWHVKINVLPILGGAEDERMRSRERKERSRDRPDLIVNGFVAFGGVSVKD